MQHVFGNIDKIKVSTGYLKEFGIRFNEVETYNGTMITNNLVDKTQCNFNKTITPITCFPQLKLKPNLYI